MAKNSPLSDAVMWQAKLLYEEKDAGGRRVWSMMEIAAKLGISETSVYRAIKNMGRFANLQNAPLPEPLSEQQLRTEAQSSLERLQGLLAAEKDERTPGKTRADKMLEEMEGKGQEVSQAVKDRLKEFLG